MFYTYAPTLRRTLAMLGMVSALGFVPAALANAGDTPESRNVMATVTAIDANTAIATLRTEGGTVFELPKEWQWHVGHKVLCTQIESWRPQFQNCRLWESAQDHRRAMQEGPVVDSALRR